MRTATQPPAGQLGCYDFRACHSVDEQAVAMPGWEQSYAQLQEGRFEGAVIRLEMPGLALYRETVTLRTENHFADPEDRVAVYFRRSHARGAVMEAGLSRARAQRPFVFEPNEVILIATIPEESLGGQVPLPDVWAGFDHVPRLATGAMADWFERLLDPAAGAFYREDAEFVRLAPKILQDQVLAWLETPGWSCARPPRARQMVRDLLAWLRGAPIDLVSGADAAQGTGHGLAELRAVCRAELDMTLERLLLVRRLNLVRSTLIRAGDRGARVSEVALHHGFTHWGRFSARYRGFFNELPSETLRAARRG